MIEKRERRKEIRMNGGEKRRERGVYNRRGGSEKVRIL